MAHISDMEIADMTEKVRRMQVEIEAAKAAKAKTAIEVFIASEPMATAKKKAAPPPHPPQPPPPELEKKNAASSSGHVKKSQIINQGDVPPLPPGILPARSNNGQLPKPAQPKSDLVLNLVLSLKPSSAPVPTARPVGVVKPMEMDTDGVENSNAASSNGHVKGDGKGGCKTGPWSSMQQAELLHVEGSDTMPMTSVMDESDSRMARIKARNEAVVACADSSREEVDKALEWLARINAPKEKTKKGMGIGRVGCTGCGTQTKWSLMDNVQVWDVDPSTISEEELIVVDVHWHWDRFCWECRAKEWGCSVKTAQERILDKGGYSDSKRRRVQEFQDAVQNVQEFFEIALAIQAIELGKKQKRQINKIARKLLLKAFSDMTDVIRRRRQADEMQVADMAERQRLLGLLSMENDQQARVELFKFVMRGSGSSCKDAIL